MMGDDEEVPLDEVDEDDDDDFLCICCLTAEEDDDDDDEVPALCRGDGAMVPFLLLVAVGAPRGVVALRLLADDGVAVVVDDERAESLS